MKTELTGAAVAESPVDWLKSALPASEVSQLGETVARLLDAAYAGIYHMDIAQLRKTDWGDDFCIDVVIAGEIATVDGSMLTILAVLSHDLMLRMSVQGHTHGYLKLRFHQRHNRAGRLMERCPTIEDHIATIRRATAGRLAAQ